MNYLLYNLEPQKKNRSGVLCLDCGWMRVSFSVHDSRKCPCPNETSVDGGTSYLLIGAKSLSRTQLFTVGFKPPKVMDSRGSKRTKKEKKK